MFLKMGLRGTPPFWIFMNLQSLRGGCSCWQTSSASEDFLRRKLLSLRILHNPQFSTCDEQVLRLLQILQTLARGVPKIILQQLEEIYPTLKVSLGVLHVQTRISLSFHWTFCPVYFVTSLHCEIWGSESSTDVDSSLTVYNCLPLSTT